MSVVVLGGGPAGLYAALLLSRRGISVSVLERGTRPGGLTAGTEVAGVAVDYGSHRLHPSIEPDLLADLRSLLGADLQTRTRNGRIRMGDRWISFPISAPELVTRLPPSTVLKLGWGASASLLRPGRSDSFADVVNTRLGRAMGELFYFPYARKIWGLEPDRLSGEQARRRISADSPLKLARKAFSGRDARTFYYPKGGFGQISQRLAEAAEEAGARIHLETPVLSVRQGAADLVVTTPEDSLSADLVLSTIPITLLAGFLESPGHVTEALASLAYRAMILVYLVVPRHRWTAFDAHYFPTAEVPFTRLSEPKNYRDGSDPDDRTVLCIEIPAQVGDPNWASDDGALLDMVRQEIRRLDLPDPGGEGTVHRIPFAYPIYTRGAETAFATVADWLETFPGIVSYGRQGLFAHDNTHHALLMARDAAACIGDDLSFDAARWAAARARFAQHVVED